MNGFAKTDSFVYEVLTRLPTDDRLVLNRRRRGG
jgi:hypothetical protein